MSYTEQSALLTLTGDTSHNSTNPKCYGQHARKCLRTYIMMMVVFFLQSELKAQVTHGHYRFRMGINAAKISTKKDGLQPIEGAMFNPMYVSGSLLLVWFYPDFSKFWFADYQEAELGIGMLKHNSLEGSSKEIVFSGGLASGFTMGYSFRDDFEIGLKWINYNLSPILLGFKNYGYYHHNFSLGSSRTTMLYPTVYYKRTMVTAGFGNSAVASNGFGSKDNIKMTRARTWSLEVGFLPKPEHYLFIKLAHLRENQPFTDPTNQVYIDRNMVTSNLITIGFHWLFEND